MSFLWGNTLVTIFQEFRVADIFLFFTLGIGSSSLGCLIVTLIFKIFNLKKLKSWLFIAISSFVSLYVLWGASLKLIEIMTIT